MVFRLNKTFIVICFFLLALPTFASAASVSASIPLDSWIYPALDKLAGLGLVESSLQGSRPFTRLEAARQTREARDKAAASHVPPVAYEILQRLERELQTSLDEAGGAPAAGYVQPIREFRIDAIYLDSTPSTPSPATRTNAVQHALNTNNFGIDYSDGYNVQAIVETEARFRGFFLLNWRPLLLLDEDESDFTTLHGTATLGIGPFSIIAGRDSLWWGQGRNGSLILTNNAKPLDMVRVTNPSPVLLPWIFRHLGPFRFDMFLSKLDSIPPREDFSEPYLFGMRINLKPRPWFEVGASRVMMYGGEGRQGVGFFKFLELFVGKGTNVYDEPNVVNQIAALDARLKLPFLAGAELYGELGGEDEAGAFIAKKALLAGLYLPKIDPSGRLGLRLEYTDLNFGGSGPFWYTHSPYSSGYTYEKNILGHHIGGDARDYYAALEYYLPGGGLLKTGVDIQRRGLSTETVERHIQPFIAIDHPFCDTYRLSARYSFDRVSNAGYVQGEGRTDHFGQVGISRSW